ncbi:hypothetical protein CGRA01v4_01115 [Colletotrichum graminicola]|nr:hypothetical protein CGRA01v4_01115 [Colletotrichum graminicola]
MHSRTPPLELHYRVILSGRRRPDQAALLLCTEYSVQAGLHDLPPASLPRVSTQRPLSIRAFTALPSHT